MYLNNEKKLIIAIACFLYLVQPLLACSEKIIHYVVYINVYNSSVKSHVNKHNYVAYTENKAWHLYILNKGI